MQVINKIKILKQASMLLLSAILLSTCVDKIGVNLPEDSEKLVVDGLITTKPGPYAVKLTTTAKYSSGSDGINLLVRGAKVSISDDLGNREELTEDAGGGVYKTQLDGIQGRIGRTYTLQIETAQGKKYQSKPELLTPTSGVENIYYEFVYGSPGVEEGFYVYIDTPDPAVTEDYYRWSWVHYEPEQYCFNGVIPPSTTPVIIDCCTLCWNIYRCNGCVNIASDRLSNGEMISRQLLAIVPYTSIANYFLYYEQQSLTRDAFKFWKALEEQTNNVGGIFDKPPATVRGNMFNIDDADEVVLGYFGASDIKPAAITVKRTGISKSPSGLPVVDPPSGGPPLQCRPCEESIARTKMKPPLWPD